MIIRRQYSNEEERQSLLEEHEGLHLIEEQNILEGMFLLFSDDPPKNEVFYMFISKQEEFESLATENEQLKQENILIKAQAEAVSARSDFLEELIAEMAMKVYE